VIIPFVIENHTRHPQVWWIVLYGLKAASETQKWINVVKRPKHEFQDQHLFRQEMRGVTPLKNPATTDSKLPRSSSSKLLANQISLTATHGYPTSSSSQAHINAEDGSSHRKNGVQKRIIQKLKRGQFPVNQELDLHHMNLETAQVALLGFIAGTQSGTLECVRIIHGKGLRSVNGPRLMLMTRQLLRDHPQVLAFTTSKPANGGSGAVDVLLRSI